MAMITAGGMCAGWWVQQWVAWLPMCVLVVDGARSRPGSRYSKGVVMVVAGNVCARRPAMGGAAGKEASGGCSEELVMGMEPALVGWQSH